MDQSAAGQPDAPNFETRRFGDVVCILGDSLNVMPVMLPKSVDFIFADMPYVATKNAWDTYIDMGQAWANIKRVRSKKSWAIFTADMRLAARLLVSNPKEYRHDIVWHKKGRPSGFLHARHAPLRVHELILCFAEAQGFYSPQMVAGEPYKKTGQSKTPGGENFFAYVQRHKENKGMRHPQSILPINRVEQKQDHPTQKPVALLEWLLKSYTTENQMVLDFCAGSGTTGVAALNLGRRAVLIEKDPAYFKIMCKRIAEHHQNIEGAREPI